MDRDRFELLVTNAVQSLPEELLAKLENIAVVVEDRPSQSQLTDVGLKRGKMLLGLYEGIPQTKRGSYYGLVMPDKITIFQKSIESICQDDTEIEAEIQKVVRHEIAHHFGIDDRRLEELGRY